MLFRKKRLHLDSAILIYHLRFGHLGFGNLGFSQVGSWHLGFGHLGFGHLGIGHPGFNHLREAVKNTQRGGVYAKSADYLFIISPEIWGFPVILDARMTVKSPPWFSHSVGSLKDPSLLTSSGFSKTLRLREAAKKILRGVVPQSRGLRPQSTDPP